MIYANIWLTVKEPGNVEKIRELLSEQARLSREEPGCARFEVYQSHNDATRFLLVERWETQEALDKHVELIEEAQRRDHRKLGLELDLFSFPDELGSGLPVFHPKGGVVRRELEALTPQVAAQIWQSVKPLLAAQHRRGESLGALPRD